MKKFDFNKIVQWLAYILRCPVCGHRYNPDQTKIIDTGEEKPLNGRSLLVHTDCDRCKSSVVFSISLDGPEIFSVGMVTDLTAADTIRFRDRESITFDEVIDFHNFLEKFDGNFQRILR